MLHEICVTTDLFESCVPGPGFINARCFGEDFATWLKDRLDARGVEADAPIQEDFGWVLLIRYEGSTFTLALGVMDDFIGKSPAEWNISMKYERFLNGVLSWLRPVPNDAAARIWGHVKEVLITDKRFKVEGNA